MKNYYDLLELPTSASADDIKKAFRAQIAKYHPDKVQHLGKEFQAMAADRAAELTEAWRILSDAGRKAEYDKSLNAPAPAVTTAVAEATPPPAEAWRQPERSAEATRAEPLREQFVQERASRDTFIRKATIDRLRQAFAQVAGSTHEETQVRGFDFVAAPRSKGFFGGGKGLCVIGRFVPKVDAAAVADSWVQAARGNLPPCAEVCVLLMGTTLAPARELADAIAEQRRRSARGPRITLIPINSSVWDAHMPTDAPAIAKDLLTRLRTGK